jgi:hypothetical protein
MSAKTIKVLGKAILLGALQSSIGSVELSSTYSINNFSKDQATLQRGADSLSAYIVIGTLWTIGCMAILGAQYSWEGALFAFGINAAMMLWLICRYIRTFQQVVEREKLQMPTLFSAGAF